MLMAEYVSSFTMMIIWNFDNFKIAKSISEKLISIENGSQKIEDKKVILADGSILIGFTVFILFSHAFLYFSVAFIICFDNQILIFDFPKTCLKYIEVIDLLGLQKIDLKIDTLGCLKLKIDQYKKKSWDH